MSRTLGARTATPILREHRLIGANERVKLTRLGGGVSSNVFLATAGKKRFVLKQPLPRFRVKAEWLVDVDRADVEARFAEDFRNGCGPLPIAPLRAFAASDRVLIFDAAPQAYQSWKQRLLEGKFSTVLARIAASGLAAIHQRGIDKPRLRRNFDQPRLFDQQRIDPYFRATAQRHPDRAAALRRLVKELRRDRTTLIHGDFSPKNMLTNGKRLILVDHEVATWGNPAFDVSFLVNHLVLKAVHMPGDAGRLVALAETFLAAYEADAPRKVAKKFDGWRRLLPALMLARVDGKSPVDYLSSGDRLRVRTLGRTWLVTPPKDFDAVASVVLD